MPVEQVNYDKFFWGMAQDDLYVEEWQYAYSEWINVKDNSNFVKLNRNVEHLFTTNWNDMLCSKSLWTWLTSETFFLWEDWEVYYQWSANDTALYTTPNTRDITDCILFNEVLYFTEEVTGNAFTMHNITEANAKALSWTWNVSNFLQTWDQNGEMIMLNYKDINLFVWSGKDLYIYSATDILTWTLTDKVVFKSTIRWITYVGSLVKIYTEDWDVTFIDSNDFTTREVVNIKIKPIKVETIENFDYIIAWYSTYSSILAVMSWHEINVIAKRNNFWLQEKFNFSDRFWDIMWFDWRQIYFAWQEMWEDLNEWIISFWNARVWLPEWFNNEFNKVDLSAWVQENIWVVTVVHPYEWNLYICYDGSTNDKWVARIKLNENIEHTQNWTLILKEFNAWSNTLNKDLVELEVYGKFNWETKIWLSVNWNYQSSASTTWIDLDNNDDLNEPIRITDLNTKFNVISIKFEFNWTFESQSPDKLYWVKMKYNITRQ